MSEPKDPAIKLFGKTIPLPEISEEKPITATTVTSTSTTTSATVTCVDNDCENQEKQSRTDAETDGKEKETEKGSEGENSSESKKQDGTPNLNSQESSKPDETSGTTDNMNTQAPSIEMEDDPSKASTVEVEQSDASNSQEKTLKKPEKILPCPRCKSMETKFCYYNNYNINQPRHFCKKCQRYWTAGGTMRNVPVGAGRRKNKNSTSQYCPINVSEALSNIRTHDLPNGIHHPTLQSNGTVLAFHSEMPLHESMASVLNIGDKKVLNSTRNGFQNKPEALQIPIPNGSNTSNGFSNSVDRASKCDSQLSPIQHISSFPPQIPCFPGVPGPWTYPWSTALPPPPAFCPPPPGFPMPFYAAAAAAYWACTAAGPWNAPWIACAPPSPNQTTSNSGPNSPTLGKHSRDEGMVKLSSDGEAKGSNSERSLWIPKTLRIDDPEEASKSSIWTTLGIKNDKCDSVSGQGLFKGFQSKSNQEKNRTGDVSPVLQVNPAALSRSVNFNESS